MSIYSHKSINQHFTLSLNLGISISRSINIIYNNTEYNSKDSVELIKHILKEKKTNVNL